MRQPVTVASKLMWAACACAALAALSLALSSRRLANDVWAPAAAQSSPHVGEHFAPVRSQIAVAPDASDDDSQSAPHDQPRGSLGLSAAPPAAPPNLRLIAVARETVRSDRTLVGQSLRLQI
jgi:hypothetical protein